MEQAQKAEAAWWQARAMRAGGRDVEAAALEGSLGITPA
jgi:hypothetical protein